MRILYLLLIFFPFTNILGQPSSVEVTEINRISIPKDIFVGELSFLDVDDEKLLVTDRLLGQILLYIKDEWISLNPEVCHPGFKFSPIEAHFGDDDNIFFSNSGIWGFRFKNNGECVGAANKNFRAPQRFSYTDKIIGLSNDQNKTSITSWTSNGEPTELLFSINNKFKNAEYRLSIGGVTESNDIVYAINSLEPILYKYDIKQEKLISKSFDYHNYSMVQEDLPKEVHSASFMKKAQELFRKSSMNYNLFELNEDLISLVVRKAGENKYHYHILIFRKHDLMLANHIIIQNRVVYIGNNSIVHVERERINDNEEKIDLVFSEINLD